MNYAELTAAAIAYADRYDVEVSNNLPTYIIMTEARINRLLKVRKQSNRAYLACVTGKEYYALPPDWAGMRAMYTASPDPTTSDYTSKIFSLVDPVHMNTIRNNPVSGLYYCILADQIQIYPTLAEDTSIEMVYYQQVPNLNSNAPTNWMSNNHPDIYLAGITAEISLFAKDYEAASGWYERLATAISELENVDWVERWSGDPLQVRIG